jgi:hypothetical protein
MRNPVEIENIEEMRRREGIDDVKLREEIGELRVGSLVRLTFLTGTAPLLGETLVVRITSIRKHAFRGKLARGPASTRLATLRIGSRVAFTTAHIHSLPKEQAAH